MIVIAIDYKHYCAQAVSEQLQQVMAVSLAEFGGGHNLTQESLSPYMNYYSLEEGGKVLAYIASLEILDESEIIRLYVCEKARRQGYGYRLLNYYISQLNPQIQRSFLEVRAQNLPARQLYQKANYQEISRRNNYYQTPRDDAIIMAKAVNENQ